MGRKPANQAAELEEGVAVRRHYERLHEDSHLSRSEPEAALCDFEYALHHVMEAFRRWSVAVHALAGGEALPVQDVSVLQVLRMRERTKTVSEIAQVLNREDTANVQYSLRKLERLGLAERAPDVPQRQTVYGVTARGREVTEQYAAVRRAVLLDSVHSMGDIQAQLEEATRLITFMVGQYDSGARRLAMHRPPPGAADQPEPAPGNSATPKG